MLRLRVQGIGDWLSAADPGYIRIQLGLRAALATLTTLLAMLVISILLMDKPVPSCRTVRRPHMLSRLFGH